MCDCHAVCYQESKVFYCSKCKEVLLDCRNVPEKKSLTKKKKALSYWYEHIRIRPESD
jgi:hypothetical protein